MRFFLRNICLFLFFFIQFCLLSNLVSNSWAFETQPLETESITKTDTSSIALTWNLTEAEYTEFLQLKTEGLAAYFWKDLDPVMVLGLSATTESERIRYAEKYVQLMRNKVKHELAWEQAYQAADRRLFPQAQAVFDRTKLYGESAVEMIQELQEGDQVLVFTAMHCSSCTHSIRKLMQTLLTFNTVSLDCVFRRR